MYRPFWSINVVMTVVTKPGEWMQWFLERGWTCPVDATEHKAHFPSRTGGEAVYGTVIVSTLLRKERRSPTTAVCLHTTRWSTRNVFDGDVMSHIPEHIRQNQVTFQSTPLIFTKRGRNLAQWLLTHDASGQYNNVRQGHMYVRVSMDTVDDGDAEETEPGPIPLRIYITPYFELLSNGTSSTDRLRRQEVACEEVVVGRHLYFQTLLEHLAPVKKQGASRRSRKQRRT